MSPSLIWELLSVVGTKGLHKTSVVLLSGIRKMMRFLSRKIQIQFRNPEVNVGDFLAVL